MCKILLLQGANANSLGKREPAVYGSTTVDELSATVALERRMAASTSSGSLRMSTTSAVSIATPVPAPMAMPRSA